MKLHKALALTVVLSVAFLWKPAQSRGARKLFSIEASVAQDVVHSGSPVKLKAEITNNSTGTTSFSEDGVELAVEVRDSTGNVMPWTEKYRQARRAPSLRRISIELAPEETRKWMFMLSDMYDLSKPGQYSAQIGWNGHVTYPDIRSNTVQFTISSAVSQSVATPTTSFTLEIDALQDVVKSGSRIRVDIFATNVTDHDLDLDNDLNLYSIEVRDQSQTEPPLTEAGKKLQREHGQGSRNHVHLKPGKVVGLGIVWISDLYDFRKPGEYSIQIARMDEETKTLVKSNTMIITVKPGSKRK
jgi:hypothetical protein